MVFVGRILYHRVADYGKITSYEDFSYLDLR